MKLPSLNGIAVVKAAWRKHSSRCTWPSVRRAEDITGALWGCKISPATINELNKKVYVPIADWRNCPLQGGRYPYVYVDGIYLRRNWGGEYENIVAFENENINISNNSCGRKC